mmetsp:Transcript_88561/g.251036  ORF Transcript_88561/g.251036 Transcript_88561/m.251036 type:complete len:210 (-) Transcript_88561:360-989(-)
MCFTLVRNLLSTSMPFRASHLTPALPRQRASRAFGFLPEATSRASASTVSPVDTVSTMVPPRFSTAVARPSTMARPSSSNAFFMTARTSSSSRGIIFPTSVTLEPRRANACASSLPIGPPPMTMRLLGRAGMSKMVSYVKYGTESRPGSGGSAGPAPVHMMKLSAVTELSPDPRVGVRLSVRLSANAAAWPRSVSTPSFRSASGLSSSL